MAEEAGAVPRYKLSFTSGALLMREAAIVAPLYLDEHDWSKVRAMIETENLLQARTNASGHRLAREVVHRLAVLADGEIELFVDATATERAHMLWSAVCRHYAFIGQFAEEVVRERFLLLTPTLTYNDFDTFVRGKSIWHEELTELRESTLHKLRANLFRMLYEAGLVSKVGHILPVILSPRVADALGTRTPSDVRFFPTVDDLSGREAR